MRRNTSLYNVSHEGSVIFLTDNWRKKQHRKSHTFRTMKMKAQSATLICIFSIVLVEHMSVYLSVRQ